MTRKKTKQAKGLFWTRKEHLEGSLPFAAYPTMEAAAQMAGKIVPFIPLDASDAGREALRDKLYSFINEHPSSDDTMSDRFLDLLLAELGFPAPSKKGRK